MTQKLPENKESIEAKFHQIELELNAILEITQAINNNASEESLYTMFKFTLRGNLHIQRLALFVLDDRWNCKVYFGTKNKPAYPVHLEIDRLEDIKDVTDIPELNFESVFFKEFDILIPVYHKDRVLAYVFLNKYKRTFTQDIEVDIRFVQALSNIILVAIENKKLVRKQLQQEAFKKEMEIAKQVQSLLFPKKLPYTDTLQIKATYFPHDLIGGDYYDYIPLNNDKFIICIADVSGKGVPAALLMSNFQASLRTLASQTQDLKQIVKELNQRIYENAQGEHFITFFIALYDLSSGDLTYINSGHNPALLFDFDSNRYTLLRKGSTVLGIFAPLPFLEAHTIHKLRNFFMFNYTDGVTEVINPEDEQFGMDRLIEFLKTRKTVDLGEIHGNLISRINLFKKEMKFTDDITLLSCRIGSKKTSKTKYDAFL